MKSFVSIACLLLVVCAAVEARPKRSVYLASPVVASVPVVHQTASVVHHNPTTVVRTEQVHGGDHSRYSYSTEVKSNPVVHTHHTVSNAAVAAVAPVAAVSTVHHAVPSYSYGYYPSAYAYHYASPYSYVIGK